MKEALYSSQVKGKTVQCFLCPNECVIQEGNTGICNVRKNIDGKLYSLTYGRASSVSVDPIEKKPLYHFYPGKEIISIGSIGCNFKCPFCQNFEISQSTYEDVTMRDVSSEEIVSLAKEYNSFGISYTYNEPLINYEFLLETSYLAHRYGLMNVLVTNGYINEAPLTNLLPFIDAANIDVKAFKNEFYKRQCKSSIGPVLRTVELMFKAKKHIEITNLIIPSLNDSLDEIKDLVDWISSLSVEIPLHFSRYFPAYKMSISATPLSTLKKARELALKKLRFVYLGNVWEEMGSNTYCPFCGNLLIERKGYRTKIIGLNGKVCNRCGKKINIIH